MNLPANSSPKYSSNDSPRFSCSFACRIPINRFNHCTYSNRRSTLKKRIQYQSSLAAAGRCNKSHCCQTNLPRSFCRSIPFVAFICCAQSYTSLRLDVNTTNERPFRSSGKPAPVSSIISRLFQPTEHLNALTPEQSYLVIVIYRNTLCRFIEFVHPSTFISFTFRLLFYFTTQKFHCCFSKREAFN